MTKNSIFSKKTPRLSPRTATINLFLMLVLTIFMLNFSSAWTSSTFSENKELTLEKESLTKYGTYNIQKHAWYDVLKIWKSETIKKVSLLENTETCENCYAIKKIDNFEKGKLIEDVKFDKEVNGKWIEWNNFINWKIEIEEEFDLFKEDCISGEKIYYETNGTYYNEQICEKIKIGTEKRWVAYDFDKEYEIGNYTIKLSGGKKPNVKYDWKVKINGIWTDAWAVWGNISEGDEAEVNLNAPEDESIQYSNPVTLNASGNVTGGAYLTNATLYDNSTGSWEARNSSIRNSSIFGPINLLSQDTNSITESSTTPVLRKTLSFSDDNITYSNQTLCGSTMFEFTINSFHQYIYADGTKINTSTSSWNPKGSICKVFNYTNPNPSKLVTSINVWVWQTSWNPSYPCSEKDDLAYGIAIILNSTQTFLNSYSSGDTILWNMEYCDSDGDCGFSETNRTFSMDTTPPTILVTSGNGTQNYGSISTNHTLNITFTDTNLDDCWINYNGTNQTFDCTSGVDSPVNFTLQYNLYNATIWANDTLGNENSSFVSWSYNILFLNSSYDEEIYEMNTELFVLNVSASSDITVNSANLIYNGSSYTSSINTSGSNKIIYNSIDIPTVLGTTNVSFYWNVTYTNSTSTYVYQTTSSNQTVNYILLTFCNATYTTNSLNFTTRDEENYSLLNNTININLNYYPSFGNGVLYKTFNYQNLTEDTSYRYLCIYPNISELKISGIVSYKSTGYDTRSYIFDNYVINNVSQNIDLYLALIGNSDVVTFTVSDDFKNNVEEAVIIIEKWDIGTGQYLIVNTVTTDTEGSASSNLILYETYYRFKVYYDGVLYVTDGPSILSTTTKNFQIKFNDVSDYSKFNDIIHTLTFNYTTNQTTFTWNNNGINITQACLVIINQTSRLKVYDNCLYTQIGTISVVVNTPGFYNAYSIVTINNEGEILSYILYSIMFSNYQDEKYRTIGTYGQAASFLLIGTAAMIGVAAGSIILGLGLMILSAIFINWLGFLDLTTFLWSIVSLIIIITVVSIRRKR